MHHLRRAVWLILTTLALTACSSLPGDLAAAVAKLPPALRPYSISDQVQNLLEEKRYADARLRLEAVRGGVAVAPDVGNDRDIMAARKLFEGRIEQTFLGEQKRLLDD